MPKPPDWDYWLELGTWPVWQAVCLTLNIEPHDQAARGYRDQGSDSPIDRRLDIVNSHLNKGRFKVYAAPYGVADSDQKIDPSSFAAWVLQRNWPNLPKQFADFAKGLAPQSGAVQKPSIVSDEKQCEAWLTALLKTPAAGDISKQKHFDKARLLFPRITKRGFYLRTWPTAVRASGNEASSKAGRKPKKS
jgi:hypothetical protein